MTERPAYLRLCRIEAKPKQVELSAHYRRAVSLTAAAESDLLTVIRIISDGTPLPERFYRKGVDTSPDLLLAQTGIMHLHLAGRDSDELLYLVQFDDFVLLLGADTHRHFASDPPGKVLSSLHHAPMRRAHARALQRREARTKSFAALRAGAVRRRPFDPET